MKVIITPSKACGTIQAPPSKSMAHRMLICAGCAEGTSIIRNIDFSEDILATIDCLRALGAEITCGEHSVAVRGVDIRKGGEATGVCGAGAVQESGRAADGSVRVSCIAAGEEMTAALACRESGSTLRFMIPLCLLNGRKYEFSGSSALFERPLSVYEKICGEQGLSFCRKDNRLLVSGTLAAGDYEIPGNVSSQFISGLLFALPLLHGDSRIRLIPPVESRPYISMTLQVMEYFGVEAVWEEDCTIAVRGGQKYLARDARVEGDYSNAAFFDALNYVGGDVTVEGLEARSLQGDRVYRQFFDRIAEGYAEIDIADCPDLGPVLMVLAAMRHGARLTGTARLRLKESDRGAAMREELGKAGAVVEVRENEVLVAAGAGAPGEVLRGHGDHRVVMALAVLLTRVGGEIDGAEAVAKSLPDFWEKLEELMVPGTINFC